MRELEFRAWDKSLKKMIYFSMKDIAENMGFDYGLSENMKPLYIKDDFDYTKFMQYTGLKDKNDKKGYHKDIIRMGEKTYLIEWNNETANFYLKPLYENSTGNCYAIPYIISVGKIIGNEYENPKKEKAL